MSNSTRTYMEKPKVAKLAIRITTFRHKKDVDQAKASINQ